MVVAITKLLYSSAIKRAFDIALQSSVVKLLILIILTDIFAKTFRMDDDISYFLCLTVVLTAIIENHSQVLVLPPHNSYPWQLLFKQLLPLENLKLSWVGFVWDGGGGGKVVWVEILQFRNCLDGNWRDCYEEGLSEGSCLKTSTIKNKIWFGVEPVDSCIARYCRSAQLTCQSKYLDCHLDHTVTYGGDKL